MRYKNKANLVIIILAISTTILIFTLNKEITLNNDYESYINEDIRTIVIDMKNNIENIDYLTEEMINNTEVQANQLEFLSRILQSLAGDYQDIKGIVNRFKLDNTNIEGHLLTYDLSLEIEELLRLNKDNELMLLESKEVKMLGLTNELSDEYENILLQLDDNLEGYDFLSDNKWIDLIKEMNRIEMKDKYRTFERH